LLLLFSVPFVFQPFVSNHCSGGVVHVQQRAGSAARIHFCALAPLTMLQGNKALVILVMQACNH
jgi:hypothetical protein